jgi:hypothetical protein
LPGMHAVKEEFSFSLVAQNEIKSGSPEGRGLLTSVDRGA